MTYDPQRSRRRPAAPEAGPAPVDALLGGEDTSSSRAEPARAEPSGAPLDPPADEVDVTGEGRPGAVDVAEVAPGRSDRPERAERTERAGRAELPELSTAPARRGSPRAAIWAAMVVLALLVVLAVRRLRGRHSA